MQTRSKSVVGLAAVCAALLLTSRCGRRSQEQIQALPFEQLGRVLARETLQAIPGPGPVVAVCYRPTSQPGNPVLGPAADTFLRALRADGRLTVAAVLHEEFNPCGGEAGWADTLMASTRFTEFVTRHRTAAAIVVVGGTPQLSVADAARLPAPGPKLIAAAVLTPPAPWLLERGVLAAAIVARRQGSEERTPPPTPQAWFDRRYEVLHAGRKEAPP